MNFLVITYLLCCLISILLGVKGVAEKTLIRDGIKKSDEVPRVKIKVFRGPSEEQNGETFTTWGFWIKQPGKLDLAY